MSITRRNTRSALSSIRRIELAWPLSRAALSRLISSAMARHSGAQDNDGFLVIRVSGSDASAVLRVDRVERDLQAQPVTKFRAVWYDDEASGMVHLDAADDTGEIVVSASFRVGGDGPKLLFASTQLFKNLGIAGGCYGAAKLDLWPRSAQADYPFAEIPLNGWREDYVKPAERKECGKMSESAGT